MYYIIANLTHDEYTDDPEYSFEDLIKGWREGYSTYTAARWVADTIPLMCQDNEEIDCEYLIEWVPDDQDPLVYIDFPAPAPVPTYYEEIEVGIGVQHYDYDGCNEDYSFFDWNTNLVTVT